MLLELSFNIFFMEELLVKEAILSIPFKHKTYKFVLKQASLKDIIEFDFYLKQENDTISKHIYELLKSLNKDFERDFDKIILNITFEIHCKIHDFFLKNYCTWFYEKKEKSKVVESIEKTPFSSIIASILTNTNETMESLLKLTWEQITYISEWLVYNTNNQTPEWKEENRTKLNKKDIKDWIHDDTLEWLREQRGEIMSKLFNVQKPIPDAIGKEVKNPIQKDKNIITNKK